jgi:diketogulonate reductase-like aldo/keto reductase
MTTPEDTAAMPPMMYGTAWKKERTAGLVYEAIKAGFRGIDTAAMKKHYDEAGTGEGIRRAISEGLVSRKDLFVSPFSSHQPPSTPSH